MKSHLVEILNKAIIIIIIIIIIIMTLSMVTQNLSMLSQARGNEESFQQERLIFSGITQWDGTCNTRLSALQFLSHVSQQPSLPLAWYEKGVIPNSSLCSFYLKIGCKVRSAEHMCGRYFVFFTSYNSFESLVQFL